MCPPHQEESGDAAFVYLPDQLAREAALSQATLSLQLGPDVDLPFLARTLSGVRADDLAKLCDEAARAATRHNREQVTLADFVEALEILLHENELPVLLDAEERRLLAHRQAGQALAVWHREGVERLAESTLRLQPPRTVGQLTGEDLAALSAGELLARLDVLLAGHIGQELAFEEALSGDETDLAHAARLAALIVSQRGTYGRGAALKENGAMQATHSANGNGGSDHSDAGVQATEEAIQRLLAERYGIVSAQLSGAAQQLYHLVELLVREERVDQATLLHLLDPPPG